MGKAAVCSMLAVAEKEKGGQGVGRGWAPRRWERYWSISSWFWHLVVRCVLPILSWLLLGLWLRVCCVLLCS